MRQQWWLEISCDGTIGFDGSGIKVRVDFGDGYGWVYNGFHSEGSKGLGHSSKSRSWALSRFGLGHLGIAHLVASRARCNFMHERMFKKILKIIEKSQKIR